MRLLARREFGAAELADRLCQKGYPKETVEIVVKWLKEKDLQNDERFVEVFVRSKKSRGQGPVRLRAELQQLAISEEVINRYLIEDDEEWIALARQVFQKRFGSFKKTRWEERAKQQRFLYYRGFSFEQINAALAQIDQ
jgi:regulatory protein